jgi:hypothetical protein
MKKKQAIIVALLIIALLIWAASLVFADGGEASSTVVQPITLNDLGVSDTGLLPSNPFYFSEEWMRDLQKIFTTGPVDRADLELQILNDKAAELLMASQLSPTDQDALSDAVSNYGNELQEMDSDLQSLNTKGADVDSMLKELTGKLLMHYQLLEGIKAENGEGNGEIGSVQERIYNILNEVPGDMSDSSQFGSMLDGVIASQRDDFGVELRSLPLVDELSYINRDPSIRAQLDQVRQDQVFGFEGRYEADGLSSNIIPGILGQLPVGDLGKFELVGDLRGYALDSGLRSELDSVTSTLIMQASSSAEISSADVSDVANYAYVLLKEASSSVQSSDKNLLVANSLLSASSADLSDGSYGAAFSEASNAAQIADGVLFSSDKSTINSKDNVSSLSDQLSALMADAGSQGLVRTDNPKLFTLFSDATSTLSGKPSVGDIYRIEEYIDEIKFALNNAQAGEPSALIPVPGKESIQNAANNSGSSVAATGNGTPQYCGETYEPVCGSDGTTYSNICFEGLVGVSTDYRGECKPASTSTTTPVQSASTTAAKGSN